MSDSAPTTSEGRLEMLLVSYADKAIGPFDASAIAREAIRTKQPSRPYVGALRLSEPRSVPRTAWAFLILGLIVAALAAVALLGGGAAPRQTAPMGLLVFGRGGEIDTLDPTTGRQSLVLRPASLGAVGWSLEGSHILFNDGERYEALYSVRPDGSDVVQVPAGLYTINSHGWSPDARYLVEVGAGSLGLREVHTGQTRPLSFFDVSEGVGEHSPIKWSRDGSRFAVVGCLPQKQCAVGRGSGSRWTLWSVPIDGSRPARLAVGPSYLTVVGWTPDSKRVAYAAASCSIYTDCLAASSGISMVDATGGDPTRLLVDDPTAGAVVWSPDGRQIAFSSRRNRAPGIYVASVDGAGAHLVASGEDLVPPVWSAGGAATWSGDGQWLAYLQDHTVWIVRPDGTDRAKLIAETDGSFDWRSR